MTNPTPPYIPGPTPPVPPQLTGAVASPPRRRGRLIGLVAVAVVLLAALVAAVVVAARPSGTPSSAAAPLPQDTSRTVQPVDEPTTVSAAPPMTASDIELTVKIKTKDCFGSAGCNVEYKIQAGIGVDPQECEVTYEVHGLEDTQIGTLDFHADGTYEQDGYQSGDTANSKKKLTATVTDVEC